MPRPNGYGWLGWEPCYEFRRYDEGYRFGKLAIDLVEKARASMSIPRRLQYAMGLIVSWTKPLAISIDYFRAAIRSGIEKGDLIYADLCGQRTHHPPHSHRGRF